MAEIHGDIGGGKFGVLDSEQAKKWVLSKLGGTTLKFASNLQSSLNDIDNDRGKATGDYKYNGTVLLHASSGVAGKSDGCTLFWVVRPGNVAKLVAVGEHETSTSYTILWRVGDWGFTGKRLQLS